MDCSQGFAQNLLRCAAAFYPSLMTKAKVVAAARGWGLTEEAKAREARLAGGKEVFSTCQTTVYDILLYMVYYYYL